jgi:thiamine biosynthesis lipoprotein
MRPAPRRDDLSGMSDPARPRHHVEHVMGMAVSIDLRDAVEQSVVDEVVAWLHRVDATYSTYKAESPISRFGLGLVALDELDPEVQGVLALCEELHDDTGGAFDIFAATAPNGSNLEPSGLVKGWSIERAARLLEARGAANFCINAGGDIALRGEPSPGEAWRIGIRHPDDPLATAAVLEAHGRFAVATSGTYERGAHIIDPSTGQPTTGLASVTITGPDLTFVDAYATAVFVMGLDGLMWLHERHPDHAGFAITHDDTTFATPNWAEHVAVDPPSA